MSDRLPARLMVDALIRRVQDAGGNAVLLARGDAQAGAILVLAMDRGADPRFLERGIGPAGQTALIRSGPSETSDEAITAYWQKRRKSDPDLWVVEVDVAQAERFAAEMIIVS